MSFRRISAFVLAGLMVVPFALTDVSARAYRVKRLKVLVVFGDPEWPDGYRLRGKADKTAWIDHTLELPGSGSGNSRGGQSYLERRIPSHRPFPACEPRVTIFNPLVQYMSGCREAGDGR